MALRKLTACASLFAVLALHVSARATADPVGHPAATFKAVCSKCHNLELVTSTPRSFDEWQETVQKMVDRGARGTDAQFEEILDLLHRTLTTININMADAEELQIVLGVSAATAADITSRRARQRFSSLEELKAVPGLDPASLEAKSRLIFFR